MTFPSPTEQEIDGHPRLIDLAATAAAGVGGMNALPGRSLLGGPPGRLISKK